MLRIGTETTRPRDEEIARSPDRIRTGVSGLKGRFKGILRNRPDLVKRRFCRE